MKEKFFISKILADLHVNNRVTHAYANAYDAPDV